MANHWVNQAPRNGDVSFKILGRGSLPKTLAPYGHSITLD